MTARPPATASGWRPRRGAGRRHPEAVDACGVVLLGSDPPPGRTASLSGGRRRVAAGRAACQRAARVLRSATALRVTHRPPRGSDGSYGPCGPAWTRASRPSTTSQGPGAPPNSERRTGPEPPARDWGRGRRVPGGGAGCAVSLCRRRVDVLTEPTGGPFSRGRRGPFFSCHFQSRGLVDSGGWVEGVREGEGFPRKLCVVGADTAREVIEVNGADCPDCAPSMRCGGPLTRAPRDTDP